MIPVLDSRRMRAADAAAIRGGTPAGRLMENAAEGLAAELYGLLPGREKRGRRLRPRQQRGDGLAAARLLSGRGLSVSVFTLGDPDSYRGDAAENASRAREAGLELTPLSRRGGMAAFSRRLRAADAVVDALFGTGLTRALSGSAARAVSSINSAGRPVVAADLPSGLSADTGQLLGPCVKAVGDGGLRRAQARARLLAGARFLRPGRRPRHRNPAPGALSAAGVSGGRRGGGCPRLAPAPRGRLAQGRLRAAGRHRRLSREGGSGGPGGPRSAAGWSGARDGLLPGVHRVRSSSPLFPRR